MDEAIRIGDKVHIVTRRRFHDDVRRHFVGVVEAVSGAASRVHGYTFVHNEGSGEFEKRPTPRVRIFGLAGGLQIVNVLPPTFDVSTARYEVRDGRLVVTDGSEYALDLNELSVRA